MGEMRNTPALDILGTRVHALTLQDAAERIVEAAAAGRQLTVFPRDAHGIVRSRSNAALARAHARADLVTADGMPLVWLQRMAGYRHAERVYGPDLMHRVCNLGRAYGLRHAILGGRPGVADRVAEVLSMHYPGLDVAVSEGLPHAATRPLPNGG